MKIKSNNSSNTIKNATIIGIAGATISGIVAHTGSSTTVYMDFCRSFIECIITVISFIVFNYIKDNKLSNNKENELQMRIRMITGITMILTSTLLLIVNVLSFSTELKEGNNIPSLITTSIVIIINSSIMLNYKKSLSEKFDHIIKAQYTMYRSKLIINIFLFIILVIMTIAPTWNVIPYIDLTGTIIMSIFIFTEGIKNISLKSSAKLEIASY